MREKAREEAREKAEEKVEKGKKVKMKSEKVGDEKMVKKTITRGRR